MKGMKRTEGGNLLPSFCSRSDGDGQKDKEDKETETRGLSLLLCPVYPTLNMPSIA